MDPESSWAMQPPTQVSVPLPTEPGLTVRHYRSGRWVVVEACGELDIQVVWMMHHHLREDPSHLVFDLSRVTFMDASGLGMLVASLRVARHAEGSVRLVGPSRQVRQMLAITELDKAVSIFASLEQALTETEQRDYSDHDRASTCRPGRAD